MFRLAHLSDLHATRVRVPAGQLASLLGKRGSGWLSYQLRRRWEYLPAVLGALAEDLRAQSPDHVAVTGDLTNLSLPDEFPEARRWLERLGGPETVSVIPGNHDAYVPLPYARSWAWWEPFMRSDEGEEDPPAAGAKPAGERPPVRFPTVRVRGPVALVGLCSARPSPLNEAVGSLGDAQLAALEKHLTRLQETPLCRVVMVHHPPRDAGVAPRRRLTDSPELRRVLAGAGAELVLHGHMHRSSIAEVEGPAGPIPVVGVRSASAVGRRPGRRAQYHLCRIEAEPPTGGLGRPHFRIALEVRGYDAESRRFVEQGERALQPGASAAPPRV